MQVFTWNRLLYRLSQSQCRISSLVVVLWNIFNFYSRVLVLCIWQLLLLLVLLVTQYRVMCSFEVNFGKRRTMRNVKYNASICFDFRRLSCSLYLTALSISDNGYLICLALIWLENIRVFIFHNNGICQITVYLTTVFSSLSVW